MGHNKYLIISNSCFYNLPLESIKHMLEEKSEKNNEEPNVRLRRDVPISTCG
jgi:hypothetical protein